MARVNALATRRSRTGCTSRAVSRPAASQRAESRCGARIAPEHLRPPVFGKPTSLVAPGVHRSRDPSRRAGGADPARPLALRHRRHRQFPFLEPPDPRAIADGWQQLNELGAVDAQRKLTATIGRTMARLPVDDEAGAYAGGRAGSAARDAGDHPSFLGIQDPRRNGRTTRITCSRYHARAVRRREVEGRRHPQAHGRPTAPPTGTLAQSQLHKWADKRFLGFPAPAQWW